MHRPSIVMFATATLFAAGGTGRLPPHPSATDDDREPRLPSVVMQQGITVQDLLARVRGVDPVVCDLVGEALRNRWGGGSLSPVLRLPGRSDESAEIARWVRRRHDETETIPQLRAALDDTDPCVRQTAAHLFDHVRDRKAAVGALTNALRSSGSTTRQAAVWALGYLEDRSTVSTLTQRLSSRDPAIRQVAAWALGRLEHADAIPALVEALGDRDVGVRGNAAWALGQIERRAAVTPLTTALRDAEVPVRLNAVLALGQIEDAGAIPALTEILQRDRNAEVRRAAAWALGRIE